MGYGRERTSTTPMDFEFTNGTGTVGDSPFATLSQATAKKRQRSAFDSSPTKNAFETPNRLHLREPHNQSVLFSNNPKPLPAVPQYVANPWAPRTPSQQSIYDSSDAGTPNTPGVNDDSEAPTPDQTIERMTSQGGKTPKRRDSWFYRLMPSKSPSPDKSKKSSHYSRKVENKVMKRRKQKQVALRDEPDSDDEGQRQIRKTQPNQPGVGASVGSFFSYLDSHPNLPATLSFWLQLSVNCCLAIFFLYIVWQAWSSVMSDVDVESNKYMAEVTIQMAECHKQYSDNNCDPKTRVPAMQNLCGNWEQCMSQDPRKMAKARVGAKAFAMIFNAFVEEFSYKSMIFTAILIFGGFNLSNWAFGLIRSKQAPHPSLAHHDSFTYPPPPQTPQRHPSGGYIDQQAPYNTQWHTPYQSQTPYGSMNQGLLTQGTQSMPSLLEERGKSVKRGLFW